MGKAGSADVWMPMFGKGAFGKGKGKAVSAGNPLVDLIKAYQKQGETEKQYWWTFAAGYGTDKDPARFEANVLQEFASMVGISVEEWLPPAKKAISAGNILVDQIKAYQRQ